MTKIEKLIQKVRDGKVAILNDGTFYQLREVLSKVFSLSNSISEQIGGRYLFYYSSTISAWASGDYTSLPTVSVKEFYEDEFVWGDNDIIEAWNSAYGGDSFLDGKDYLEYIKQIKLPLKTKLTHQMIADKFGIDVNNLEII